jgi:hypothetical protein
VNRRDEPSGTNRPAPRPLAIPLGTSKSWRPGVAGYQPLCGFALAQPQFHRRCFRSSPSRVWGHLGKGSRGADVRPPAPLLLGCNVERRSPNTPSIPGRTLGPGRDSLSRGLPSCRYSPSCAGGFRPGRAKNMSLHGRLGQRLLRKRASRSAQSYLKAIRVVPGRHAGVPPRCPFPRRKPNVGNDE